MNLYDNTNICSTDLTAATQTRFCSSIGNQTTALPPLFKSVAITAMRQTCTKYLQLHGESYNVGRLASTPRRFKKDYRKK